MAKVGVQTRRLLWVRGLHETLAFSSPPKSKNVVPFLRVLFYFSAAYVFAVLTRAPGGRLFLFLGRARVSFVVLFFSLPARLPASLYAGRPSHLPKGASGVDSKVGHVFFFPSLRGAQKTHRGRLRHVDWKHAIVDASCSWGKKSLAQGKIRVAIRAFSILRAGKRWRERKKEKERGRRKNKGADDKMMAEVMDGVTIEAVRAPWSELDAELLTLVVAQSERVMWAVIERTCRQWRVAVSKARSLDQTRTRVWMTSVVKNRQARGDPWWFVAEAQFDAKKERKSAKELGRWHWTDAVAKRRWLNVLRWAHVHGMALLAVAGQMATHTGDLAMLKWLWSDEAGNGRCVWTSSLCDVAADRGHLKVLKWLRANGCEWREYTCEMAAGGGHLEVLKWLRRNGCEWDVRVCRAAAEKGHLRVLRWARQNGCPWDDQTTLMAATGGHLAVLRWVHARRRFAGHVDVHRYKGRGRRWPPHRPSMAARQPGTVGRRRVQ